MLGLGPRGALGTRRQGPGSGHAGWPERLRILFAVCGNPEAQGEGTPAPAPGGCVGGRTPRIFRPTGDGEYIFCTQSMSGLILLAFSPCPLAALWPAPLGPTHVFGLEGAFSTPSSDPGRRWAVCPPALVHMRALRLSSLFLPVWKPSRGPSRPRVRSLKVERNPGILRVLVWGGSGKKH